MIEFIKRIFSSEEKVKGIPSTLYNDFEIRPQPVHDSNGWRVSGTIVKEVDGILKEHEFVRADSCADQESAVALTLRKAQQFIDEQGERIFD